MRFPRPSLPSDPRWLQISFLSVFIIAGVWQQVVPWSEPILVLAAALTAQALLGRWKKAPRGHLLSGVITGLGVSLLLRSDLAWLPPLVAAGALLSKFLIRIRGKHVFNPANGGIAIAMLVTPHAWCSPSQWTESSVQLLWIAALGMVVVVRSLRSDVSLAFLLSWVGLKLARIFYLNDSVTVLLHQLSIASLIIFTFFMISDPRTTPDHRGGRIAYAFAVALLAMFIQHKLWIVNAPIWALFFLSPLVPLIDFIARSPRFSWPHPQPHGAPCASPSSPSP